MPNQESKPTLVFDFWSSPKTRLQAVHRGEAPRESLLGYIQLLERQWRISASDDRWGGPAGSLRQKLRGFLEIPSYRMIRHWMSADVVIIVTRFSPVLAIIAKVLGKKLVFLDAMQQIPTNKWRRAVVRFSLRHSDAVICYSRRQAAQWAEHFGVPPQLFTTVRYCLDADFYRWPVAGCRYAANKPYLISVGRDPERDFATLVEAAELLELNVKLVTLPYLVDQSILRSQRVEVFQHLTYPDLFSLYACAAASVIPVRRHITYMAGIRGAMESMALGVPTIATRTPGLEEYFADGEDLLFFDARSPASLAAAILRISRDEQLRRHLIRTSRKTISESYSVTQWASSLEKLFLDL